MHKLRLENYQIDRSDREFDCVIMCEVLEHLNFNPLPLMKEINRVLKLDGLFYLALPNQAQIRNRLRSIRGAAVGISVGSFFDQLDPNSPVIANGHWREYTKQDILELLVPLGFRPSKQYYFSLGETQDDGRLKKRLGRAFYRLFPQFKENQTNLLIKAADTAPTFSIPPTVHPTLRRL